MQDTYTLTIIYAMLNTVYSSTKYEVVYVTDEYVTAAGAGALLTCY
jgi:hypothetical protein